jgi:hypothetical protein
LKRHSGATRDERLVAVRAYAAARQGYDDILQLFPVGTSTRDKPQKNEVPKIDFGSVYLLKSGRYYKIGRSNAVGRRERELSIQLPEKADVVHAIRTDDPPGIEAYWHKRFGERRKNGEWLELARQDIDAFKRRKFM